MRRRTWIKRTGQLLLASSALVLPAAAFTQGREHGRGRGRGGRGPGGRFRFLRDLDLTDDQREQFRSLSESNRDQMESVGTRLFEANKALNDAVENGAEEYALRALADDVAAAQGDAAVMRSQQFRELKALLTPEQLQKLEERKAEREQHRNERRQRFEQRRQNRRQRNQEWLDF